MQLSKKYSSLGLVSAAFVIWLSLSLSASAQSLSAADVQATLDNVWVTVAAVLVIFMNAGFAMVEAGFCRRKNSINILAKNLIVFALASLAFWATGFALMFGAGNTWIGNSGWFLTDTVDNYMLGDINLTLPTFFLFQTAFAGTAATIVSGTVAERIRFRAFLIFSVVMTGLVYPITGHWIWGGGWLGNLGFIDFAGSTVVHSVGGWAALMGAILLGPRLNRYQGVGTLNPMPGHSLSLATLGCLILWIGWFGFNAGSTLAADITVPYIAVTTNLAAAAGLLSSLVVARIRFGTPDLSFGINGVLGGLVAITASCNAVSYVNAILIGAIAGVLVVFSVNLFDQLQVDDPVGALSVHLVCGIWGTLAVGILSQQASFIQFTIQLCGLIAIAVATLLVSGLVWWGLKQFGGIRVSAQEEEAGLDLSEHANVAYLGFLNTPPR
ncbi:ammonium transporter [Leptothoe kymatousa]|uniref:Ammonium transporter n=1 Tax=Leptothoe kymatousa TAU-MAC 1615 TaxID=2364775 RepID=A0ABS5XYX4_9CYAN|nr:ammonium transporter [Leptothoe kymatousa]MBT9310591.1 ammonium transporter [Leptothoe kymatousa TAU-MAC 1615]